MDELDKLGLAIRELVENIMPNMFNSINSIKFELTYTESNGSTKKEKIDITKEFKRRLDFIQYVTYGTKMNIRKAELDNIRESITQSLQVKENSNRFDLSETYKEIDDSYQVMNKSKAKDA